MAGLNHAQAPITGRRAVFDRAKFFNQPNSKLLLTQFISLFHPYSYIYKPPKSPWLSAKDPRWKLSSSEICKAIAGQHYQLLGTRWGNHTRHAVLDIDANSRYHNKSGLRLILKTLRDAGFENPVTYQSSESGGWHIYIFFAEKVLSRKLRDYFLRLLRIKGFVIKSGTLEVFPDPGYFDALGQGLRLPLQQGFAWLHPTTHQIIEERDSISPAEALQRFMDDLERHLHTQDDYKNFLNYVDHLSEVTEQIIQPPTSNIRQFQRMTPLQRSSSPDQLAEITEAFGIIPPNIIPERWLTGRKVSETGLTEESQRHEAELSLGHYYFYGDPSRSIEPLGYGYEDERKAVMTQILFGKHNGLSKEISEGRAEVIADISRSAHWTPTYMRDPDKLRAKRTSASVNIQHKLANIKRRNMARARIKQALEKLLSEKQPIRVGTLQTEAGVSRPTLYNHQDIWRKYYEQQCLTGSLGVISDGGGGVTPLNPAQLPSTEFEKPLEFLAARQIVDEIKARALRAKKRIEKQQNSTAEDQEKLWENRVRSNISRLPADLIEADSGVLKQVSAILRFLRGQSPHFDAEQWLLSELEKITTEQHRRYSLPITDVPKSDSISEEPFDFHPDNPAPTPDSESAATKDFAVDEPDSDDAVSVSGTSINTQLLPG